MVLFNLERIKDVSGVSGTGVVAQGVEFDDGTVAMRWLSDLTSTAIYASMSDLLAIHGHNGSTIATAVHGDFDDLIPDRSE